MAENSSKGGANRASARFGTRLTLSYKPADEPLSPARDARVLDLSEAGVRFNAAEQFGAGVLLQLKLMFPGGPMDVKGKVVRVIPGSGEAGKAFETAAAFLDLNENQRDTIDMWFYREKMSQKEDSGQSSGSERRRSGRFEVTKAHAELRKRGLFSSKKWERGIIRQISKHGVLLQVKSPFDYGDRLEALLHLPAYSEPIRVVGKVVRVKSKDPGMCLFYRYEIGLEFVRVKKYDLEKLKEDEYLQSLIERSDSECI